MFADQIGLAEILNLVLYKFTENMLDSKERLREFTEFRFYSEITIIPVFVSTKLFNVGAFWYSLFPIVNHSFA